MYVERFVAEGRVEVRPAALFGIVRVGPCPWCSREDVHAHELREDGDTDRRATELESIGAGA
jgi:hypothetical protein